LRRPELAFTVRIRTHQSRNKKIVNGTGRTMMYLARPGRCSSMPTLLSDLRYGVRTLRQNPGFTTAAILSLTLGIGANTAIFQLIDAVRLRTLPVEDPNRLAMVQFVDTNGQRGVHATPYPALTNLQWEQFRDSQDAFSGVLAWWSNTFGIGTGSNSHAARGLFVSGDYFRVLGVQPLRGRLFTGADDRRGCGVPGAVISYAFWQRREFGGAPSAIGSKLAVNYQPIEIIGVTPANFSGLEIGRGFDIAVPICAQAALWSDGNWLDSGTTWWLNVIGRLKPGQTLAQAAARLKGLSPGLFQATLPANYPRTNIQDYLNFKLTAVPAATGVSILRRNYSDPLALLLITAALVLLVACANLANLMLARATAREHEITVRLALGASRTRLIRQLMVESVLLSICGATLGLYLSGVLSRSLVAMVGTQGNPFFLDLTPDRKVVGFAVVLATTTCLLFGLIPAWRATRLVAADAMRSKGRGVVGHLRRFGLRQVLVVSQVALSLVLLVGALLFSGSLRKLLGVDTGFRQNGVLIADVDFRRVSMPASRRTAFKRDLLTNLRALSGVDGAGEVSILPLSGASTSNSVWVDGGDGRRKIEVYFNWVSSGYLNAMGIPLLAGRDFDFRDSASSPRVAIVNQAFARQLGLGKNPIGLHFRRESTPTEPELAVEAVGLVRDSKYIDLREDFRPTVFLCTDQNTGSRTGAQFVIRSSAPLPDAIAQVRAAVGEMSLDVTIDFQSFAGLVGESLIRERLMATLSSFFGVLAAVIAGLGIYGVMTYLVARRTNEIGVRVALGANRGQIVSLILRQSAMLLAAGLGIGLLLALAGARAVKSLLFGLQSYDVGVLTLAVLLLAAVSLVASYLPARRASHLEPTVALREE
jgi:putative ABC transport system permease protein